MFIILALGHSVYIRLISFNLRRGLQRRREWNATGATSRMTCRLNFGNDLFLAVSGIFQN